MFGWEKIYIYYLFEFMYIIHKSNLIFLFNLKIYIILI
jgi:hypothetical protein